MISSNVVVGVADPVGFFGDSFVFAAGQFLDAAVVRASVIEVDLGEEFRIGGKGGCSSTSKALGLKNSGSGLVAFLVSWEKASKSRCWQKWSFSSSKIASHKRGWTKPLRGILYQSVQS
jgi:hypothetical protein